MAAIAAMGRGDPGLDPDPDPDPPVIRSTIDDSNLPLADSPNPVLFRPLLSSKDLEISKIANESARILKEKLANYVSKNNKDKEEEVTLEQEEEKKNRRLLLAMEDDNLSHTRKVLSSKQGNPKSIFKSPRRVTAGSSGDTTMSTCKENWDQSISGVRPRTASMVRTCVSASTSPVRSGTISPPRSLTNSWADLMEIETYTKTYPDRKRTLDSDLDNDPELSSNKKIFKKIERKELKKAVRRSPTSAESEVGNSALKTKEKLVQEYSNSSSGSSSRNPFPATSTLNADKTKSVSSSNYSDKPFHKYNKESNPPYIVHVQHMESDKNGSLHPLHISRILTQIMPRDIMEIKKIGRTLVMAELRSFSAANKLVEDPSLTTHKLRAFIPAYRTIKSGIIRDIPIDLSDDIIKQNIESSYKIIDINRLNRRIRVNNEFKLVSSQTICIKFAGQILPKQISLFKTKYNVTPFIPRTRICYACFRIGHISKVCKGQPRCIYCGNKKHQSEEICPSSSLPYKCLNCEGNHLPTSFDCPRIIENKMIQTLAATNNVSISEARLKIKSNNNAIGPEFYRRSVSSVKDPRFDFQGFPFLTNNSELNSSPTIPIHNKFQALGNAPSNFNSNYRSFANVLASNDNTYNTFDTPVSSTSVSKQVQENTKQSVFNQRSPHAVAPSMLPSRSPDPRFDILIAPNGRLPPESIRAGYPPSFSPGKGGARPNAIYQQSHNNYDNNNVQKEVTTVPTGASVPLFNSLNLTDSINRLQDMHTSPNEEIILKFFADCLRMACETGILSNVNRPTDVNYNLNSQNSHNSESSSSTPITANAMATGHLVAPSSQKGGRNNKFFR